ncbi:hypothetical protein BDN71DRAFT_1096720 [Pleurotus eryngii]|uniref:Uncharacterized protein n=1 Tax=Pleurotus eryngii TaxID=5323 RepID=A0A9P5ZTM5_PLEER|nr:hypothetical protein BDN71DRAFT_1096720 [Pleurotus eryngii]
MSLRFGAVAARTETLVLRASILDSALGTRDVPASLRPRRGGFNEKGRKDDNNSDPAYELFGGRVQCRQRCECGCGFNGGCGFNRGKKTPRRGTK